MKRQTRLTILLSCLLAIWSFGLARAQTDFTDDFNRPDGTVGNGWSTWHGGTLNSPDIAIADGQLKTVGASGLEGGVFRELPTTFPLTFSFQFRTDTPSDGGWDIRFNAASVSSASQLDGDPAELEFLQFRGGGGITEVFRTQSGTVSEPLVNAPGQRDYQSDVLATISGQINPDLSTLITVVYGDGMSPDVAKYFFAAPQDAALTAPGDLFILSNSSASDGPHFFDNVTVETTPEGSAATLLLAGAGGAGSVFLLCRRRGRPAP